LRIVFRPRRDLRGIDEDGVFGLVDPRSERLEFFGVVILADSRIVSIIPPMNATDEVSTLDVSVTQEDSTVETPAVQNRNLVVVSDNHEIDALDAGVCGFTIGEVAPDGDLLGRLLVHVAHVTNLQDWLVIWRCR
jgi:hypothetical protein